MPVINPFKPITIVSWHNLQLFVAIEQDDFFMINIGFQCIVNQPGDVDMPANALAEAQAENENQSQSQSESQSESQSMSQTHTFSAVSNEDVLFKAKLLKQTWVREEVSLAYLVATKDLISAHELPGMSNIFKAEDHISTSPFYTKDLTKTPLLPPVRYLLARSEGDPKVILINQDEANEFKKGRKAPWTLYDLRSVGDAPAHALKPIEGADPTS